MSAPALPPEEVRARFVQTLPSWRVVAAGAWASAVVATLITLSELDRLVGQVVDLEGRSFSITGLTGPARLTGRADGIASWGALADVVGATCGRTTAAADCDVVRWATWYARVDLVFVVLYTAGLGILLARASRRPGAGRHWLALAAVGALVGGTADALESLLIPGVAGPVAGAGLVTASQLKWWGLLVAFVAGVVGVRQGADRRRGPGRPSTWAPSPLARSEQPPSRDPGRTRRVVTALFTHRFSLLVVIPFAVLGLAAGTDILDQLPDVQRRWVDDDPLGRLGRASGLTLVIAVVVTAVGRLRSHHVRRRVLPDAAPYDRPALLPWLVTALVITAGALVSAWRLGGWQTIGARFGIAVALPLLVWGLSLAVRRWLPPARWSPYRVPVSRAQAATTLTVGDVIGVLTLAIPALGLVRSFVAPVALGTGGWATVLLGFGLVVALLAWPAAVILGCLAARVGRPWVLAALTPGENLATTDTRRARVLGWGFLAAGTALFLALGWYPHEAVAQLGVVEVVLLGVTALALSLGSTVVILQAGGAPDILSRRGTPLLRTAPVMTLVVLTAVAVGTTGSNTRIHGLRVLPGDAAAAVADRPTPEQRLLHLAADPGCAGPLGSTGYRVRPVYLLAAEGGGIRAAAWTALGTDALAEAGGRCAEALMSSGASGGAVGLTVAAFPESDAPAFTAVTAMAGPEALGAAVAGLLVRDPVRSVTGIPFPLDGADGWVDRAGLIEGAWEDAAHGLRRPYLGGDGTGRVTGALVLNSTSVATHCRTLLSQLALDPAPDARTCRTPTAPTDSVDLLATLRTTCPDAVPVLRASTVALLASRFPYVTPSGVVSAGCRPGSPVPDTQQVVDGGYADNDGLGTLVDLAPAWMPALRAHNAEVVRRTEQARGSGPDAGEGAGPPALLVPVLVYLDNGTGSDIAAAAAGSTNEVLVPLLTKGAATAGLSSTDSQLHRALGAFSVAEVLPGCGVPEGGRPALCDAVQRWRGPAVKVFYQPTQPSIAAPLGWVLSTQSLATLRCARDGQVAPAGLARLVTDGSCREEAVVADDLALRRTLVETKGYGSMADALRLAAGARAAP